MKRIQIPIFLGQKKTRNVGLLFCAMLVLVVCLLLYRGELLPKGNRTISKIQSIDEQAAQVRKKAQAFCTKDDIRALATNKRLEHNESRGAKSMALAELWRKGQFEVIRTYAQERLAKDHDDFPALLILFTTQTMGYQPDKIFQTALRIIDLSPKISYPDAKKHQTLMMLSLAEMCAPQKLIYFRQMPSEESFAGPSWDIPFVSILADLEKGGVL